MILSGGGFVGRAALGRPVASGGVSGVTGLDWNGDPSGRRAIVFTSPLAAYPATYLFKVYQRQQVTRTPNDRYYTTFFHGNNGAFVWHESNYATSYYGAHPYPEGVGTPGTRDGSGDGKWEISAFSSDDTQRDDGTYPHATMNAWYSQAFVCSASGGNLNHKFYIDLPSTSTANTITTNSVGTYYTPTSPCVIFGQAPDNGGVSWGGYVDWEEQNAIIRGVQIYESALTEAQIVALAAKEHDSDVLSYCAANSITSLWYLNMNWTLSDISDKSGNGNDPAWAQTNSALPSNWSG